MPLFVLNVVDADIFNSFCFSESKELDLTESSIVNNQVLHKQKLFIETPSKQVYLLLQALLLFT